MTMAHEYDITYDAAPAWHPGHGLRSGLAINKAQCRWIPARHAQQPAADATPEVRRLTPDEAREVLASFKRKVATDTAPTLASLIPNYLRLGGPAR